METHWRQTAHLRRLRGVVREAPKLVTNLVVFFMLLGLFWGSFGLPWGPFGVPFGSIWLSFGTFGGVLGVEPELDTNLVDVLVPLGFLCGSMFRLNLIFVPLKNVFF